MRASGPPAPGVGAVVAVWFVQVPAGCDFPDVLRTGDLDGDGATDVLVLCAEGAFSVALGNGDGTFGAAVPVALATPPNDAAIADFAGDGKPDVVIAAQAPSGSDTLSLFVGKGDGGFEAPRAISDPSRPSQVGAGDVDRDGNLDVLGTAAGIRVFLSNGDRTFGAPLLFATGQTPDPVLAGDIDGDGQPDVVAPFNDVDDNVSILLHK